MGRKYFHGVLTKSIIFVSNIDNCQQLQIDKAESQFQLYLEKAKALSLDRFVMLLCSGNSHRQMPRDGR
jgi:hypothetical protein